MLSFYTVPSLQLVIMYQLPTAPDVHGHLALAVCVGKHHPSLARSHSRRNGFATWYLDLTAKAESPLIRSVVSSLWDCYSGITTRSITSTLVNPKVVTPIKAVKQIDFILSIKCRGLLLRYALLIALAFVLGTKFAGLIEGFHSTPLRIGSCDYVSLLAAEGISHSEYQKRTLISVNAISQYLKSIRRFLRDASLGKQLKGYLFARSEEVNAKSFIFSFTQLLSFYFVSEYILY
jgi:hypothetical protein